VRVIDYRLEGIAEAEPIYRLVTTVLDPPAAPAEELAALYQERWEIETALDELKTPPARSEDRVAEQDARLGPPRILRAPAGALCGEGTDAGSGVEGGRRSRPALFPPCRAGDSSQAARLRRSSPLGQGMRSRDTVLAEILQERVVSAEGVVTRVR
jgi:hypothetical protein